MPGWKRLPGHVVGEYAEANSVVANLARLYLYYDSEPQHDGEQEQHASLTATLKSFTLALLQHNRWAHTYLAVVDEVYRQRGGCVAAGVASIVGAPATAPRSGQLYEVSCWYIGRGCKDDDAGGAGGRASGGSVAPGCRTGQSGRLLGNREIVS